MGFVKVAATFEERMQRRAALPHHDEAMLVLSAMRVLRGDVLQSRDRFNAAAETGDVHMMLYDLVERVGCGKDALWDAAGALAGDVAVIPVMDRAGDTTWECFVDERYDMVWSEFHLLSRTVDLDLFAVNSHYGLSVVGEHVDRWRRRRGIGDGFTAWVLVMWALGMRRHVQVPHVITDDTTTPTLVVGGAVRLPRLGDDPSADDILNFPDQAIVTVRGRDGGAPVRRFAVYAPTSFTTTDWHTCDGVLSEQDVIDFTHFDPDSDNFGILDVPEVPLPPAAGADGVPGEGIALVRIPGVRAPWAKLLVWSRVGDAEPGWVHTRGYVRGEDVVEFRLVSPDDLN